MTKVVVVQLFSLLVSYTSFCDKYVWIWRQNVIQVWHSPPSPPILWTIILLLPLCNFLRFWLKLLLSNFLFVCFKLEAGQIKESAELWASQKESKHHPALKSFVSIQFLSHIWLNLIIENWLCWPMILVPIDLRKKYLDRIWTENYIINIDFSSFVK